MAEVRNSPGPGDPARCVLLAQELRVTSGEL